MTDVTIKNLHKSYGSVEVMHGIDVEITSGEFVVLVGPSGCGKSTLLRMIAGLEDITKGTIQIDGNIVNDIAPKDRDIAMVFQNYALYPQMTVAQNMSFSLEIAGKSKEEIRLKVDEVASILGIEELLTRKPASLSGGQRQRVAMGRAIIRDPKVFLFDEPLSNLDAKLRVQMRAEIQALHERLKGTVVYVTHDQVEAMTMATKIVVMNNGHIEQTGTPLDLYDNPVNTFVASFLGSPAMNFFNVIVREKGLEFSNGSLIPLSKSNKLKFGQKINIGIRPEKMKIVKNGQIFMDVTVVEPTGADTVILGNVGQEKMTAISHSRVKVRSGDRVAMSVREDAIYYFDENTGRVI